MQLLAEERETIINLSDVDDQWEVYTCQKRIMTKLKKIGVEPYKIEFNKDGSILSAKYKVDYAQISFRKKIQLTEEQKEKRRQTMLNNLQNQN